MPRECPSCWAVSVHITNDPRAEDVSLVVLAGHYVTPEVSVSMCKFLVVANGLKSNKKSSR